MQWLIPTPIRQSENWSFDLDQFLSATRQAARMGRAQKASVRITTTMVHTWGAAPRFGVRSAPDLQVHDATRAGLGRSRLPAQPGRPQWHAPHSAGAQSGALMRR